MYIPTLVVLVFLDFLGTKRNFITFTHTKNKSTYAMHYLPKQLRTLPTGWREYWTSISSRDFCLYTIDNRIFPGKLKMQSLQSRSRICFGFCGRATSADQYWAEPIFGIFLVSSQLDLGRVLKTDQLVSECERRFGRWQMTKLLLRSFPGPKQKFWKWTDFAGVLRALDFS